MKNKSKRFWIIVSILSVILIAVILCAFTPPGQLARALIHLAIQGERGPKVIKNAWSPDMEFEAYVVEMPSIDPPNQTLYIQRRDDHHFVIIAKLVEDVDSIRSIKWSPTSDLVIFLTHNYLYAVHTPGYEMASIFLAEEFYRYTPGKFNTYGGGIPERSVKEVAFPEPGVFSYQLTGEPSPKIVRMAEMLDYSP